MDHDPCEEGRFLAVFFREHDTERYFDTDSRQYMEQSLIDRFPESVKLSSKNMSSPHSHSCA
jgi:hypothetical protein